MAQARRHGRAVNRHAQIHHQTRQHRHPQRRSALQKLREHGLRAAAIDQTRQSQRGGQDQPRIDSRHATDQGKGQIGGNDDQRLSNPLHEGSAR